MLNSQNKTTPTNKHFGWIEPGFQVVYYRDSPRKRMTGFALNYSFEHKHYIKGGYHSTTGAIDTAGSEFRNENVIAEHKAFYLQYGIGTQAAKRFILVFYTGISYNKGVYKGEVIRQTVKPGYSGLFGWIPPVTTYYYNNSSFHSLGIPITLKICLPLAQYFSIGMDVYGDISKYPSFGVSFNFGIGYIRNKTYP